MAQTGGYRGKMEAYRQKMQPWLEDAKQVFGSIGSVFRAIGAWLVRFRKIILAVPVMIMSARLAQYSYENLPATVGIDLLANGAYAQVVSRDVAVLCPMAVTLLCLVLMFCSRRTIYPWIISIFSLVLPVLIILTNLYPA